MHCAGGKRKAGGRSTDLRKKKLQEEEEGKEEYCGEEGREEGLLMDVLKISPPIRLEGGMCWFGRPECGMNRLINMWALFRNMYTIFLNHKYEILTEKE